MYRCINIKVFLFSVIFGILGLNALRAADLKNPDWQPSPTGAAVRSLIFPGWGQVYARQPLKAVIYGGIEQGFMYGVYHEHKLYQYNKSIGDDGAADFYKNNRNRMAWYLAAALIVSTMDAYVDAHLYNFDVSSDLSHKSGRGGFLGSGVNLTISWRTF
ncbi:hypothetical protein K9N50_10395 [bacterium]|nr:hypothetical protein [bacterium]